MKTKRYEYLIEELNEFSDRTFIDSTKTITNVHAILKRICGQYVMEEYHKGDTVLYYKGQNGHRYAVTILEM